MTNKTKPQTHTPGPWKIEQTNAGDIGAKTKVRVSADDGYVCHVRRVRAEERHTYGVRGITRTLDEVRANGRLIAAAPELLDAVKYATVMLEGFKAAGFVKSAAPVRELESIQAKLNAVIAKAEGGR